MIHSQTQSIPQVCVLQSQLINNSFKINAIKFKISWFIFLNFHCGMYFAYPRNLKRTQQKAKQKNPNIITIIIKDYSECLLIRLKFMRLKLNLFALDCIVFLLMCQEISFEQGRAKNLALKTLYFLLHIVCLLQLEIVRQENGFY